MKKIFQILFLMVLVLTTSHCGGGEDEISVQVFSPQQELRHEFSAELVDTPSERATGLMFRESLGKNEGMLFVFPQSVQDAFWMKNTLIPLDMLFIDPQKKVVTIVHRAEPLTTTPRESEFPYQYVLEILGGRSEELGIKEGDLVSFEIPSP